MGLNFNLYVYFEKSTDMDRSKYNKTGTNRMDKPKKSCTGVSASTVQSTTLQRKNI